MSHPARDPWQGTRSGEQGDPLLPRWFVLTAILCVPVALAAFVAAFVVLPDDEVPVAERRPPPAGGLTTAVGEVALGPTEPMSWDEAAAQVPTVPDASTCPPLSEVRIAGEQRDLAVLGQALAAVCDADPPAQALRRLRAFAEAGGTIRFAAFELTGVDSTAARPGEAASPAVAAWAEEAPVILVNARFLDGDPGWVAPLLAHDATLLDLEAGTVSAALAARRDEHELCRALFDDERQPSRACDDADALLSLDDPAAALRAAGFR